MWDWQRPSFSLTLEAPRRLSGGSAPEDEEQAPPKGEGAAWKEAVMGPARSLQAAVES